MKTDFINKIHFDISYPIESLPSQDIYIADITGYDSIAALVKIIEDKSPGIIIPSVILLGCEFGDKNQFSRIIDRIRNVFERSGVKISDGVLLDINLLWKFFIGKSINKTIENYNFFSPCIACHLLMHISRIKLSQYFRSTNVISGERELHGFKEKINQLPFILDLFNELFNSFGITHHTPIRHFQNNQDLINIINKYRLDVVKLDCLFSDTYYDQNNKLIIDMHHLKNYVKNYLINRLNNLPENIKIECSIIPSENH
jgi:hypothetical protein